MTNVTFKCHVINKHLEKIIEDDSSIWETPWNSYYKFVEFKVTWSWPQLTLFTSFRKFSIYYSRSNEVLSFKFGPWVRAETDSVGKYLNLDKILVGDPRYSLRYFHNLYRRVILFELGLAFWTAENFNYLLKIHREIPLYETCSKINEVLLLPNIQRAQFSTRGTLIWNAIICRVSAK